MGKYKKCDSCGKKASQYNTIICNDGRTVCTICDSCLRIGVQSEKGYERLIEIIRGKMQNAKTKNTTSETICTDD